MDCRNVTSLDVVALTLSSVVDCDKPDRTVVVSIDSCWLVWSCWLVVHVDALFASFGSKATRDGTLDARFKIWEKLKSENENGILFWILERNPINLQLTTNQLLDYVAVLELDSYFDCVKTCFAFVSTLPVHRNLNEMIDKTQVIKHIDVVSDMRVTIYRINEHDDPCS